MKNDNFAEIAAGYAPAADRGLKPLTPPVLPDRPIFLNGSVSTPWQLPKKTNTPEELKAELADLRKAYAPFLAKLSPELPKKQERFYLHDFTRSLDGAEALPVHVPEYGGPTGKHTAVYTTDFSCSVREGKTVFVHFEGVDYIAEVFVNGSFVGRHEGFFAPFEFEISRVIRDGNNVLTVIVHNDHVMMANVNVGDQDMTGDKIYAATGYGWDDAKEGWHHCPPGFGICNDVYVEYREKQYITDLFPRVNSKAAELWIECGSSEERNVETEFEVSVYGRNFSETVYEKRRYVPSTRIATGIGDTLTEAQFIAQDTLGKGVPLKIAGGYNRFILPLELHDCRIWTPETPWLYEVQVTLYADGKPVSTAARQFGVRDFTQDNESTPKGRFYLNGKEIRLRGANTMGFEQQDILRGDFDQLIDDILLAKLCRMNFLRITQRPIQSDFYDYCDRLGMMIQTDMPLFGTVRINQYCETLRQTEEMERLIRSHASCILCSYINEPFPNSANHPHRMITRDAMMKMFDAMDDIVHLQNPDRVTKHVDGDYDPPSKLMPDNHCYTMWYNGHGLDMGRMHKGWWLDVKPGWYCGCGEYGAEGLDSDEVMTEMYPKEWLTEPFDPANIIRAQTAPFHYFFYETPKSRAEWLTESRRYQGFATKLMTSALRRNPLINTFAIHLFIDAWPSGWMKSIVDCKRIPKPAYFAYRDCLSPDFCSLRTDRFSYFGGETATLEAWMLDDTNRPDEIQYVIEYKGKILYAETCPVIDDDFQGLLTFAIPETAERTNCRVLMAAKKDGVVVHWTEETLHVWPAAALSAPEFVSPDDFFKKQDAFIEKASSGETVILSPLQPGAYTIADHKVTATACGMSSLYIVSRDTNHPLTEGMLPNDFQYLYNAETDMIAPVIETTLEGEGLKPVLMSGNQDSEGNWHPVLACGELPIGKGKIILCQLLVPGREHNPVMTSFLNHLSSY